MQKELNRFSTTARHFLKFLYNSGRNKKIQNTVKVVTVDDNLQSLEIDYCGPFQTYFYLNLFEPVKGSVVAEPSSKKTWRQGDRYLAEWNVQRKNST